MLTNALSRRREDRGFT